MTAKEVVLSGGAPWGFRIHGGADSNQPLRIARVNPGSRASLSGLREGDVITSINGRPTNSMTNAAARALMQNPGPMLKLSLNEHGEMSIRRKSCNEGEDYREQPMFNRVPDEQSSAHAPVYSTVKSPLTYTLPSFHSLLKESTSVDKVSSSNEAAPKIHISNPFYVPQNNQPEGLDRSHVSLNLDRHKTYETPLVSDNAKNITIPSYSNIATQTNGFSSLPYEVNYLPNCKREDDGSLKSYNASPLFCNKKSSNKNCENSYTKHKNYDDPFDTSIDFDSEKYSNSNKNNTNKENGEEVISINKHEIREIEEIKTYKKYVLSGETSFELGDTQTNGTGEPFDDPPILHNAYSSLSDSQLFKAKTFHTTQDESLNKERNTMPKQRASRDGLHRNG